MLPLVMMALAAAVTAVAFLSTRGRGHPARRARAATTAQEFLCIEDLSRDMIRVGNGRYRAVIEVEPINASLQDITEVSAMLAKWRSLLMSLRHPLQIYIGSQRLDPQEVVAALDARMPYLSGNRLAYAQALRDQLYAYTAADALLVKKCYLVVIWDETRIGPILAGTAEEAAARDLSVWCRNIIEAFRGMGLRARRLTSNELAQLIFTAWLRDRSRFVSLKDIHRDQPFALHVTGMPLAPAVPTAPLAPEPVSSENRKEETPRVALPTR